MAKSKIEVIEKDEFPVCPYCEKELSEIHVNAKQSSLVEWHKIAFCPHCRKALGISFMRSAV